MSDITPEQFEDYIDQMRKSVGLLDKLAKQNAGKTIGFGAGPKKDDGKSEAKSRKAETEAFARDMKDRGRAVGGAFRLLDVESRNLSGAFQNLTKKFAATAVVGAVFEQMAELGEHWIKNYREVVNVGQTFNGSILGMARAAAQAGMPLNQFTEYMKKNSKLMAVFGAKDVTQFSKNVRVMSHQYGMFGFTIEGMNDLSASWMDVQRALGNQLHASSQQSIKSVLHLAGTASGLSEVFGTARDDIIKQTHDTLTSPDMLLAAMADPKLKNNQSFMDSATVFSSIKGPGGDILRNLLGAGMGMGAQFSPEFATLQKVGLGAPLSMLFNNQKLRVERGENGVDVSIDTLKKVREMVLPQARLALQQGIADPEVKAKVAALVDALQNVDLDANKIKSAQAQAKQMDAITKMLMTIGDKFNILKGNFLDGLLRSLGPFNQAMDKLSTSPGWKALTKFADQMGVAVGGWLAHLADKLAKMDPNVIAANIDGFAHEVFLIGKNTAELALYLGQLSTVVLDVFHAFQSIARHVGMTNKDGSTSAGGTFLAGIATYAVLKGLKNFAGGAIKGVGQRLFGGKGRFSINGKAVGGAVEGAEGGLEGAAEAGARTFRGGRLAPIGLALAGLAAVLAMNKGGTSSGSGSGLPSDPTALLQLEVTESQRTNQLLESILKAGGFAVPGGGGGGGGGGDGPLGTALDVGSVGYTGLKVAKNLRSGGLAGLLEGGAEGAGSSLLHGGLLGAAIESLGYLTGDRKFNMRNLGKSALRVGGGAAGALLGSGLASVATGYAGYKLGDWAGNLIFGSDDEANGVAPARAQPPRRIKNGAPSSSVGDPVAELLDLNTRQLNNLRRQTQLLEERLPPMKVATKGLDVQAAALNQLTKMLALQEAMVDKLERNLRNQVGIDKTLIEIRDKK